MKLLGWTSLPRPWIPPIGATHEATIQISLGLDLSNFKLRVPLPSPRRLEIDEQAAFDAENFHVIPQLPLFAFPQLATDGLQFDHDLLLSKVNQQIGLTLAHVVFAVF